MGMNPERDNSASALKQRLIQGMVDYMELGGADDASERDAEWDAGYTQADVDACADLLDRYEATIRASDGSAAALMHAIEHTVTALNELNYRSDEGLIETDQREYICAFMECVIVDRDVDIDALAASQGCTRHELTDTWRDW